ncbi:MAG: hypothetical protein AB4042_15855 [Leptolyngbyaceae cyanobacterium]
MIQTEFEFTLPKGYLDEAGVIHRHGVMRLSRAMDEIVPLRDPRVKSNPAYATVMILSRVILKLGALDEVTPRVVEEFFTCDLDYLQKFYRQINELEIVPLSGAEVAATATPELAANEAPPAPPSQAMIETEADLFSQDGGPPMVPPSPRARAATSQS